MSSQNFVDPKIIADIKSLNVLDKLDLVEDIWGSILQSKEKLPVSTAHKKDLDQRFDDYQKNPNEGLAWEAIKKRIKSKK